MVVKSKKARWVLLILSSVLVSTAGGESYLHASYDSIPPSAVGAEKGLIPGEASSAWDIGFRDDQSRIVSDLTPPGNPYIIEGDSGTTQSTTLAPPADLYIIDSIGKTLLTQKEVLFGTSTVFFLRI
ncbi:MAG: hypothetical protein C4530_11130 [Desulfobacteraceae bacterium]|nr:MAG: hypothetical protein C4530_11130 [Desulfobacteraceae bacterium]